jgi:hypothetical protein
MRGAPQFAQNLFPAVPLWLSMVDLGEQYSPG